MRSERLGKELENGWDVTVVYSSLRDNGEHDVDNFEVEIEQVLTEVEDLGNTVFTVNGPYVAGKHWCVMVVSRLPKGL